MPPAAAARSRLPAASSWSSATRLSRPSARTRTSRSSPWICGIDITKWNTVVTKYLPLKDAAGKELKDGMGNPLSRTLITDLDGVFASGDAEIGPLTVVACIGNAHRAAKVIQRWLEEGKVYLTDDEIMEDILVYLGVYDKNEQVPWLDSASAGTPEGDPRQAAGHLQELQRSRTRLHREPGGPGSGAVPAVLPRGHGGGVNYRRWVLGAGRWEFPWSLSCPAPSVVFRSDTWSV